VHCVKQYIHTINTIPTFIVTKVIFLPTKCHRTFPHDAPRRPTQPLQTFYDLPL
jgi:hypothetical protein